MSTAPAGAATGTARPAAMVQVLSNFTGPLQVCDGRSGPPRTAVRRPSISVVERFGRRPSNFIFLLEHDLFRKPVPTFRDHAPAIRPRSADAIQCMRTRCGAALLSFAGA